jgi:hypothetical protein
MPISRVDKSLFGILPPVSWYFRSRTGRNIAVEAVSDVTTDWELVEKEEDVSKLSNFDGPSGSNAGEPLPREPANQGSTENDDISAPGSSNISQGDNLESLSDSVGERSGDGNSPQVGQSHHLESIKASLVAMLDQCSSRDGDEAVSDDHFQAQVCTSYQNLGKHINSLTGNPSLTPKSQDSAASQKGHFPEQRGLPSTGFAADGLDDLGEDAAAPCHMSHRSACTLSRSNSTSEDPTEQAYYDKNGKISVLHEHLDELVFEYQDSFAGSGETNGTVPSKEDCERAFETYCFRRARVQAEVEETEREAAALKEECIAKGIIPKGQTVRRFSSSSNR